MSPFAVTITCLFCN